MQGTSHDPLIWRRPSSCPSGAACIEIAALPDGGAAIRDGKDPQGPELRFSAAAWTQFILAIKAGELGPQSAD